MHHMQHMHHMHHMRHMQHLIQCTPGVTGKQVCAACKTQQSMLLRQTMQALRDGVQEVAVKVLAASQFSGIAEGIQLQILKKVWSSPSPPPVSLAPPTTPNPAHPLPLATFLPPPLQPLQSTSLKHNLKPLLQYPLLYLYLPDLRTRCLALLIELLSAFTL